MAFLAAGGLSPASGEQRATKTQAGVTATLRWANGERAVSSGNAIVQESVITSGSIEISGRGVRTSRLPIPEFISAVRPIVMVTGPRNGCGALNTLALIPSHADAPPYVVAFAVEAWKGCRPLSTVFVPVRASATEWRYVNARQYRLEHPELDYPFPEPPFIAASTFVVLSAQQVSLPIAGASAPMMLTICYGEGAVPRAIALDEGSGVNASLLTRFARRDVLVLSTDALAHLAGTALARYKAQTPREDPERKRSRYYNGFVQRASQAAEKGDFASAKMNFEMAGRYAYLPDMQRSIASWVKRTKTILAQIQSGELTRQQAIAEWHKTGL